MKINVEMTEGEFDEFLQYRKGKRVAEVEFNDLRRKAYRLRERVLDCIQINEKNEEASLSSFKDAKTVVDLAYEF